jgi:hypothetical protein
MRGLQSDLDGLPPPLPSGPLRLDVPPSDPWPVGCVHRLFFRGEEFT